MYPQKLTACQTKNSRLRSLSVGQAFSHSTITFPDVVVTRNPRMYTD